MKFLLEVLGMTNYCNLDCDYCDWEKNKIFPLSEAQVCSMKKNLLSLRKFVDQNYPEIQLVEYSGGEPFVYPDVVFELMKTFPDKWIRVITNGTLIKDEYIEKFKQHGKVFLAVSLDGYTLEANKVRFHESEKLFQTAVGTIDKLVKAKIPVMILCTLSQKNVKEFESYITYLEKNYPEAIENGMLVLPAHSVCDYGKDRDRVKGVECEEFIDLVKNHSEEHPIIGKMKKHYESLAYFLKDQRRFHPCKLYDWSVSVHFRGKEIVEDGNFYCFGCGMRGIVDLGIKNINEDSQMQQFVEKIAPQKMHDIFENPLLAPFQCRKECFVDWEAFDLLLNGDVTIEEAENWFVLFQDEKVKKFVEQYKN